MLKMIGNQCSKQQCLAGRMECKAHGGVGLDFRFTEHERLLQGRKITLFWLRSEVLITCNGTGFIRL